ncbi:MAG: 2-phospho-L-lactate transferase CofD family protein, partial [bacterium]|nr:2-phospho-L-lactate transferase CofD family protein [bacterium]
MNKFFIEKEIEEIPQILQKRRKISLKKFSDLLEEPILICGVASSIDLPGWGIEEMADRLGINVKVRYSNEVQDNFPADVVIALSASGETEETIAALKKARAKIKIAITGNKNSSIARYATHVIPLICGEYFSDSATKSVVEQAYIVQQLLSERFGQYVPITDKEIDQIRQNLKLEFAKEAIDVFRRTNRVVIIGQRGFAEEVETKFQEVARIQAEGISGPLIFYSTIEVLNQGDIVLVVDPERMVDYESALMKASRSRDIFYLNQLKIKGSGFYKTIIRYAGLIKLIIDIGKARNIDIDHPEILTRTTRGFKTPLFTKVKQVVAIGGGSGIPSLIRAFKKLGHNVTGITSMVDSGGSAGKLRRDYKVLPPGDIRRIIAGLSDHLRGTEMMNYRFKGGSLDGHTLGNILIAAMEKI